MVKSIPQIEFGKKERAKGWVGISNLLKQTMYGVAKLHRACWSQGKCRLVDTGKGLVHDGAGQEVAEVVHGRSMGTMKVDVSTVL